MIWHVLEVWALLAVMFAIGCLAGAYGYGAIGRTRLAPAQGAVADTVGDVIDSIKARVGMAPAWRPGRLRNLERPAPVSRAPEPAAERPTQGGGEWSAALTAVPALVEAPASVGNEAASTTEAYVGLEDAEPSLDERAASAMRIGVDGITPKRPPGLSVPRGGAPDNLQRIKGIGRRNEALLNTLGIYHFGQIAAWTPAEIRWIGQYLSFPERIQRDDWPGQATLLAMGNDTGFEKSADRRRRRRREQRQFAERMATATTVAALAEPEDGWADTEGDPYATSAELRGADAEVVEDDYFEAEYVDDEQATGPAQIPAFDADENDPDGDGDLLSDDEYYLDEPDDEGRR